MTAPRSPISIEQSALRFSCFENFLYYQLFEAMKAVKLAECKDMAAYKKQIMPIVKQSHDLINVTSGDICFERLIDLEYMTSTVYLFNHEWKKYNACCNQILMHLENFKIKDPEVALSFAEKYFEDLIRMSKEITSNTAICVIGEKILLVAKKIIPFCSDPVEKNIQLYYAQGYLYIRNEQFEKVAAQAEAMLKECNILFKTNPIKSLEYRIQAYTMQLEAMDCAIKLIQIPGLCDKTPIEAQLEKTKKLKRQLEDKLNKSEVKLHPLRRSTTVFFPRTSENQNNELNETKEKVSHVKEKTVIDVLFSKTKGFFANRELDKVIHFCTENLDSTALTLEVKEFLYLNRAFAYHFLNDHEKAIQDAELLIVNYQTPQAYFIRGYVNFVYHQKHASAYADFLKGIQAENKQEKLRLFGIRSIAFNFLLQCEKILHLKSNKKPEASVFELTLESHRTIQIGVNLQDDKKFTQAKKQFDSGIQSLTLAICYDVFQKKQSASQCEIFNAELYFHRAIAKFYNDDPTSLQDFEIAIWITNLQYIDAYTKQNDTLENLFIPQLARYYWTYSIVLLAKQEFELGEIYKSKALAQFKKIILPEKNSQDKNWNKNILEKKLSKINKESPELALKSVEELFSPDLLQKLTVGEVNQICQELEKLYQAVALLLEKEDLIEDVKTESPELKVDIDSPRLSSSSSISSLTSITPVHLIISENKGSTPSESSDSQISRPVSATSSDSLEIISTVSEIKKTEKNRINPEKHLLSEIQKTNNIGKLATYLEPPKEIAGFIQKLLDCGASLSFIVGGLPRDVLLNMPSYTVSFNTYTNKHQFVYDIDIVTDATREQIIKAFPWAKKIKENKRTPGLVYSTMMNKDDFCYKIQILQSRAFIQAQEEGSDPLVLDANTRDMYRNAAYMDSKGRMYTPLQQTITDLCQNRISMIGVSDEKQSAASQSFEYDPIRILRVIHASKKAKIIDDSIAQAIAEKAKYLLYTDNSELKSEEELGEVNFNLNKLFSCDAYENFTRLFSTAAFGVLFPRLLIALGDKKLDEKYNFASQLTHLFTQCNNNKNAINWVYAHFILFENREIFAELPYDMICNKEDFNAFLQPLIDSNPLYKVNFKNHPNIYSLFFNVISNHCSYSPISDLMPDAAPLEIPTFVDYSRISERPGMFAPKALHQQPMFQQKPKSI